MIKQPWHYDKCDKVRLSASMLTFATTPDDEGDTVLSAPDYGVIDDLAELTTQLLPGLTYEGANWDGVVWLERMEEATEGSLAHHLLYLLNDGEAPYNLPEQVEAAISDWLTFRGIPLRSHALNEE